MIKLRNSNSHSTKQPRKVKEEIQGPNPRRSSQQANPLSDLVPTLVTIQIPIKWIQSFDFLPQLVRS